MSAAAGPILRVEELAVRYPGARGRAPVDALAGVDLEVPRGGTLALVGESGSGKSTLARAVLRLVDVRRGRVWFAPEPSEPPLDLVGLRGRALRRLRPSVQVVFQDPGTSLHPRLRVGAALAEPLRVHRLASRRELSARVGALLEEVGLGPELAARFPHELSGGQRQRVGLARALATRPRLLVLDETLAALDVSVQAQVLNLLTDLQRTRGLSYLFVAHDLSVVRYIADLVAVLYRGRVVERGRAAEVLDTPAHPFTRALLAAVPARHPRERRRLPDEAPAGPGARGAPSGPAREPSGEGSGGAVGAAPRTPAGGCQFRARCPVAEPRCEGSYPPLDPLSPTHAAACHLTKEYDSPS